MKPPPSSPEDRWQALVHEARADHAPPVGLPRLLRAVRAEPLPVQSAGWLADWCALVATPRLMAGCCACAGLAALLLVWEIRDWNQLLAWAQLLGLGDGGLS